LFFISCGSKSTEDGFEELVEPIDATEEISKLSSSKKYTKEVFSSYVQNDGIHSYSKDEWLNNTPLNDELSQAKFKEKEVVFTGIWSKYNSDFSSNQYWTDAGMQWDFVHVNPNCWSNPNVPNTIEIKITVPEDGFFKDTQIKKDLSDDKWTALKKKLSGTLAGKEVAIKGKITKIIAKGGTSACEDATLRIWIDGTTAKVYDLNTKKRVF
jgi:hypothetical protein